MTFDFDALTDRRGTGSLKWDAAERFYGVSGVIPLWVADMDFPAPPAVIEALRRRAEHGIFGYPLGPREAREPIQRWLRERQGWTVERDWILRCPGVVPDLCLALHAFTQPGDKVVIQTPVYHPFYQVVENNGRRLVRNPLRRDGNGRWTMDLEQLERAIDDRTRLIILCSPHNPVGRVWSRGELEDLGRVCAARGLIVIADEIHADLVFPGFRHTPFAALGEEAASRTVTFQAPSKTFNVAGLSTAFAVIPDGRLRALFQTQIQNLGLTVGNIFGDTAMAAAYTHGAPWLDALMSYLEGSCALIEGFLAERVPNLRFFRPEGTYLGLLDARGLGLEPQDVQPFFLRSAKVFLDDGAKFGDALGGFLRFNIASPRPLLRQALERIEAAVKSLAGKPSN